MSRCRRAEEILAMEMQNGRGGLVIILLAMGVEPTRHALRLHR